jgi:adenosylhomocysteine nucleosidase
MIGLLSAMEEEIQLFRSHLETDATTTTFAGITFDTGTINDIPVALARCGVGKVNAAMAAQAMIDRFGINALIFTGLAGGLVPNLKRGDVVIANFVGQHDVDLTAFGRRPGQVSDSCRLIEADPKLVQRLAKAAELTCAHNANTPHSESTNTPQVLVGTIVTGDSFIADIERIKWLQREFGAIAAEMEGAAVGQVCQANHIPFAVVRIISDSASGGAAGEFIMFLDEASERSYGIIEAVLPMISAPRKMEIFS